MLESLQNMGFVKFVAKFFSPERVGTWINDIIYMINNNTMKAEADRLLGWAVVIIVSCTIIDWLFYFIKPEQRENFGKIIDRIHDFILGFKRQRKPNEYNLRGKK